MLENVEPETCDLKLFPSNAFRFQVLGFMLENVEPETCDLKLFILERSLETLDNPQKVVCRSHSFA
jgi:hypothetical protein